MCPHDWTPWVSVRLNTWLGFIRRCALCGQEQTIERQLDPTLPQP